MGVIVELNNIAYNNKNFFLTFIVKELLPTLQSSANFPSLLLTDIAGFHTTETVLEKLCSANIM
ncbi:hypothetical protein L873DRAFT_1799313, partial [Choiromyces venosus 120613-1]